MSQSERDPLDRVIGANMKRLRLARGLSQAALGACLGVTFQQIQKYESGTNSISAANLARLTVAFGCHFYDFFQVQVADSDQYGLGGTRIAIG